MSRIRTIKPAFFQSITLANVSLAAERHFAGLFTYADDEGRGQDEARLLKAALWPLRDTVSAGKVESLMAELEAAGLINRYAVAGRAYFQIVGWSEHQRINRPTPSKYPAHDGSVSQQGVITADSLLERKGKERKGKEAANAARFDEFWKAYPKKVAKGAALKAWLKCPDAHPLVLADLSTRKWPPDPTFIPYPATYLNARRWEDEGPEVQRKPSDEERAAADRRVAEHEALARAESARKLGLT